MVTRRFTHRHHRGQAHITVGVLAVSLALAGSVLCGCGEHSESAQSSPALISGSTGSTLSPAELARVRRSALVFAHSYAASTRGSTVLRDATPALKAELQANRARSRSAEGGPALRIVALALNPQSATRVDVTATLAAGSEAPFPILFVLRLSGEHWLAARLPGN
jgi:hypothetical protein